MDVVTLSRLQFGLTAMYHFIFVPLTLGLSILLAIMESLYVMTGRTVWRDMTKFWGLLFGINFAMGVATGLPLEFQFGMNWGYYSHYVGDVFGSMLAIEGLMAFFMEATFVGLFFFGWQRLSKIQHLTITWLMAIGTNLSALWILIANGWMQNPVGSYFNIDTLRMEMTSFYKVMFNPVAQCKFVHTISAGYVTGAVFVMAISAYYALRGQHLAFARRSMTVAASFGLASALSVVILGDESGYVTTQHQHMKIATLEAMWETEAAPAGLTLFGFPDSQTKQVKYSLKAPWLLGLMATRSFTTPIPGINELVECAKTRIKSGVYAYDALQKLKENKNDPEAFAQFKRHEQDLGYALLLKRFVPNPRHATDENISQAADYTVPNVPVMFYAFRIMVGLGLFLIFYFMVAFYFSCKRRLTAHPLFLKLSLLALPTPWIAAELGWFVAEHGRQPWIIEGILPTFLSASTISANHVWVSLTAFITFYSVLAVVDFMLIRKYIKLGPTYLGSH